jgi:site-specific DNA recombinase
MRKVAIYLRVTTSEQAVDGYGLDAQKIRCEAMATVKGWPVVGTFSDEGISGIKDEPTAQDWLPFCKPLKRERLTQWLLPPLTA